MILEGWVGSLLEVIMLLNQTGHTNSLCESPRFLEFDVKENVAFVTGDKTANQMTIG